MPVFLIVIGLVVLSAVINDQLGTLGSQASKDLFGHDGKIGFIEWAAALLLVGGVFKAVDMPQAGKALVALVILAYLLGHTDVPNQFLAGLQALAGKFTPTPGPSVIGAAGAPAPPVPPVPPAAPPAPSSAQ